MFDLRCLIFVG